jgi:hypothetical protein
MGQSRLLIQRKSHIGIVGQVEQCQPAVQLIVGPEGAKLLR